MTFIMGVVGVALLWWLLKSYTKANPKFLAPVFRKAGGVALLAAAAFLALRGRLDAALFIGPFGAMLLGVRGFSIPGFGQRTTATPGQQSRVRSALIEMVLDHDTGDLSGRVLAGPLEGRELDSLGRADLASLARMCGDSDPDGMRLLEAYLDRRFPGWRETAEANGDAGAGRQESPFKPAALTEQEAYEVLGLAPGASADDIRTAHRSLMKKLHPDQGGSTYLATRVNLAKDVLLSRHR